MSPFGYSGIDFNPAKVEIAFNTLTVLKPNYEIVLDEAAAKDVLSRDHVIVRIDLHQGTAIASFYTCDLTEEYIHINASYRT